MASLDSKAAHFRPDIQGLRGIAVLLVLIYHTGFALPGGFVGVDMFFVISGFVITQVLIREQQETGSISLLRFYARRAWRLVPALSVVMIFTLIVSIFVMSPFGDQQQIIKTAIASNFFAGNIHLFAMDSYEALKNNPLRHLWSLGVEEQFYWVFPVFVYLCFRSNATRFARNLLIGSFLLALVSFVLSVLLTYGYEFGYQQGSKISDQLGFLTKIGFHPGGDWPTKFAFFGAPSRFWEILLGSITAIFTNKFEIKARLPSIVFSLTGALLVLWASLKLNSVSAFPGYLALAPTLGTVFLILFGRQFLPVQKFLTHSKIVYVGDISYSLYLWHWPLIVFSKSIWPHSNLNLTLSVCLSFMCAIMSHKFIEIKSGEVRNFRSKRKLSFSILYIGFFFIVIAICWMISKTDLGIPRVESKWENFATKNGCADGTELFDESCRFGSDAPRFTAVLIGDSTARSASDGVVAAIERLQGEIYISHMSGCSAIFGAELQNCRLLNEKRFKKISERKPDVVILANYQNYMVEEISVTLNKFETIISYFANTGIPLVVQGQIPECIESISLLKYKFMNNNKCSDLLPMQYKRNTIVSRSKEITFRYSSNEFVDPAEILCPNMSCTALENGSWNFSDSKHLSPSGSRELSPLYFEAIGKALSSP